MTKNILGVQGISILSVIVIGVVTSVGAAEWEGGRACVNLGVLTACGYAGDQFCDHQNPGFDPDNPFGTCGGDCKNCGGPGALPSDSCMDVEDPAQKCCMTELGDPCGPISNSRCIPRVMLGTIVYCGCEETTPPAGALICRAHACDPFGFDCP